MSSWAFLIADLVIFVSGLGAGPTGSVAAITAAVSGTSLLANFTSTAYATAYRASLSKSSQQYLKNAQNIIVSGKWSGGTYGSVKGF